MAKEEIERRKGYSKTAKFGPWVTDYVEMAKKTVIRHMWKYLPISVEIQQQTTKDEVVRKDITEEAQPVNDFLEVEFTTSEIEETEPIK